ncbi:MAG: na+/H+ ion antiporter subunit [Ramlibacter sp.]|jgi:multicomponent K+:H+ antiporter subunit E|nr:na+/H+ ion antiporter subunit [Ramlibacter sp.]
MNPQPPAVRRWLAHPWLSLFIAAGWLLLQGSLAPVHWIWAAVFGLVLPWAAHDFIGPARRVRPSWGMLRLVLTVSWDIVVANVAVARLVLDPTRQPRPAWLRVRHGLDDPRAVVLLATIITTTPGTVSCVIEEERGEILVHALDAPDADAVAADIVQRYAAPLREIFR